MKKSVELQALRGIAVGLVVLFHLGFGSFRNGWIGVDIFFVLSGFLMWELYQQSILRGNHKDFYIRRLRRLLPALSVLLLFSNFIFYLRFLPYERQQVWREAAAANIFASNINYWMGDQYFSDGSLRPLLNLWSIALEIQFYIFFPLIVLAIRGSRIRIISLFMASFISFLILSQVSPQTNFFLLPGRLWEFLAGILVAFIVRSKSEIRPDFNIIFCLCLIFLVLTMSLSLNNFQKVVFQIASVALFSLLIWASWCGGQINNLFVRVGRLGDYSYSIYLVHYPILVLVAYRPFLGNPVGIESIPKLILFWCLLILSSWILKRFIEDSDFLKQHFVKLWGASVALSALLFILQPVTLTIGFNSKEVAVSSASKDRGDFRCGILLRLPLFNNPSKTCLLRNSPEGFQKVLLIGNSHANAIKEAVVMALPNRSVYLLNENNPLGPLNIGTYKAAIKQLHPETVILHSSAGSTDFEKLKELLKFTKSEQIDFVVIDPVPTPGFDVPSKAFSLLGLPNSLINFRDSGFTETTYNLRNKVELETYSKLASQGELKQIPVVDLFCKPYCEIVDSRSMRPLYFDYGHVTNTGALRLVTRIRTALA